MVEDSLRPEILLRLKKVEGQMRGIQKMLENDRSRVDIIVQMYAARKALNMVSLFFLKIHLAVAVSEVIQFGNKKKHIDDFMDSLYMFIK
jgi:DNA-binding FrmR family transcriptional regulator